MKYLVKCEPKDMVPVSAERMATLIERAIEWIEARLADGSMDCNYVLPGRGGVIVMNADSHEDLLESLLGYPLYPAFQWDVQPLCDWRRSFDSLLGLWNRAAGDRRPSVGFSFPGTGEGAGSPG